MSTRFGFGLSICVLLSLVQMSLAQDEWPEWRGPNGQGHATATNLPTKWSETENVTWKTPIPGHGHSSPVISGNEIWLTTSFIEAADEADKEERLKSNTGSQPLLVAASVTFRAIGLDRNSGKVLHDVELWTIQKPQWVHTLNTYASPTPIIADGMLYCHFGSYGTGCLDTTTGQVIWKNLELQVMHENGPGSSPLLLNDRLILTFDGSDKQFVAALDAGTGKVVWKTDRSGELNGNPQLRKAYGTPIVVEMGSEPVVVSPGADWIYGYAPADGRELWRLPYEKLGFSLVPRPVVGNGMIYMSTSFMRPEILAIRYEKDGAPVKPHIVWRFNKQAPKMPSPLLVNDQLYCVSDSGIATCLDAATGEVHWQQRLGGNHCASPLLADGKIFFLDREGKCTILRPGKTFEPLAENTLDGGFFASAAAIGNALYLRTDKAMYRIESAR